MRGWALLALSTVLLAGGTGAETTLGDVDEALYRSVPRPP